MAEKHPQAGSDKVLSFDKLASATRFANISKLITRDLNNTRVTPSFFKYTKDEITSFLANPYRNEKRLRDAVIYMYGASSHFRRLIQYFVGLSDLAYVVSPYNMDTQKANKTTVNRNYRKVLNVLSSMKIKTQFPQILTVCLREDVFYGTFRESENCTLVQRLPSEYCSISSVEGNVPNISFDFSYFDRNPELLEFYSEEFQQKYKSVYQKNTTQKWIELDSPNSFAVKCNNDILDYAIPPFAGILREIYDIEDYKALKLSKTAMENYAMLLMKLPMDKDGNWLLDDTKAERFWRNLDSVLPEEVGSILSPMDIEQFDFDKSNVGDTNTIADAEQNLFTSAGVSSLLFNNEKASANALSLSIKSDQAITFGVVKGIEDVVNRYLQHQSFGKYFKVTFLNVSSYNAKEFGDLMLKAAQYGMPTVSMYCASQGLSQAEMDSMSFLENDVLDIKSAFIPLMSSNTMATTTVSEGGRPTMNPEELTDSGESAQELR